MRTLSLLLVLGLAACGPRVATIDGAETGAAADIVRVTTMRVISPASSRPRIELRTSDGLLYAGQLEPTDGDPGIGGPVSLGAPTRGARLTGNLAAQGTVSGPPIACRFDVLNPRRMIDGGGVGLCRAEGGRRLDFVF